VHWLDCHASSSSFVRWNHVVDPRAPFAAVRNGLPDRHALSRLRFHSFFCGGGGA
jgi:hypothetical protein